MTHKQPQCPQCGSMNILYTEPARGTKVGIKGWWCKKCGCKFKIETGKTRIV